MVAVGVEVCVAESVANPLALRRGLTRKRAIAMMVAFALGTGLPITALVVYYQVSIQREAAASLSPTTPLRVAIQSSNTKRLWIQAVVEKFNGRQVQSGGGRRIEAVVYHTGSPLQPQLQPLIWSPASTQWVRLQQRGSQAAPGVLPECPGRLELPPQPLVTAIATQCKPTIAAPVGIAMWRSRATALGWPNAPISYRRLLDLAVDPRG